MIFSFVVCKNNKNRIEQMYFKERDVLQAFYGLIKCVMWLLKTNMNMMFFHTLLSTYTYDWIRVIIPNELMFHTVNETS